MKKTLLIIIGCVFIYISTYGQTELWGMTVAGGQYGVGTIFKTDGSGNNLTIEHSFYQIEGATPGRTKLIQANDGTFYGTTYAGGSNNIGIIYQFNPITNTYTKRHDFTLTINGRSPMAPLLQASDGKLYGVAAGGAAPGIYGVLYQYDIVTNVYTKKIDFSPAIGHIPAGSLIQHTDGNLYGMTSSGGANGFGVLFQYDPVTDVYTKKIDFAGTTNGRSPKGELMQASDGTLYGMTSLGGTNNKGTIFQYDPTTNALTKKFDFDGTISGSTPYGTLTEAADGMFYGMTSDGGTSNAGVLFQYDPTTTTFTKKLDFTGANGAYPQGSLMQAGDGKLYGTTYLGGFGYGVLFQYDPITNTSVNKFEFDDLANGGSPKSTLMQASDGKLYGLSESGLYYSGVMFQYDPGNSTITNKIVFGEALNGRSPSSKLLKASDGMLYGMTSYGGSINKGTLFQYNPITHYYTKKMEFDYNTTGGIPYSSLIQTPDGMLYGTARDGGANNNGVIFQFDPVTNVFTNKYDFIQTVTGQLVWGSLLLATDGNLYGLTQGGGINFDGTLYQYNPVTNMCTKKLDFDGVNGSNATGGLIQAFDGKLYGSPSTILQYDPVTDISIKKADFVTAINGVIPLGSMVQTADGKFYGMTSLGGPNNLGVLFQYDPVIDTINNMLDFAGTTNGSRPSGSLLLASDGNLYGMTFSGGTNNLGVMFQYDPVTEIYTKKIDFTGTNGSHPNDVSAGLIEISASPTNIKEETAIKKMWIYPNPTEGKLTITLSNVEGTCNNCETIITDVLGKEVFNEIYKKQIDISSLEKGIYFLSLYKENRLIETKKVIVNH